jgi:hypothetical protein
MAPLKPLTVKIDEDLEEKLLELAALRQQSTGERCTVSDLVREMLDNGIKREMPDRVRISDGYTPIGRDILKVVTPDDVEDGILSRDLAYKAWSVANRQSVPEQQFDNEGWLALPTFEIASKPTWEFTEGRIKEREVVSAAMEAVARNEDAEIFNCLLHAVPDDHRIECGEWDDVPYWIDVACGKVRNHELAIHNIIFNPGYASDVISRWSSNIEDRPWLENVRKLSSTMCPDNIIYVTAAPDVLGRILVDHDVQVVEADEPSRLRYGRVVWESIGIAIVNDYAAASISVNEE